MYIVGHKVSWVSHAVYPPMQAVVFEVTEALLDNDDSRHGHDVHNSFEALSDCAKRK